MGIQRNMAAVMRAYKEQQGLSLAEFSAALEISRSALQEYLAGTGNPNLSTIEHMAEKMGISPLLLVAGDYSSEPLQAMRIFLEFDARLSRLDNDKRAVAVQLLLQYLALWS